jgi:hypothetical protein
MMQNLTKETFDPNEVRHGIQLLREVRETMGPKPQIPMNPL